MDMPTFDRFNFNVSFLTPSRFLWLSDTRFLFGDADLTVFLFRDLIDGTLVKDGTLVSAGRFTVVVSVVSIAEDDEAPVGSLRAPNRESMSL